ncbi:hypothetical protein P167DRAFT_580415 [Morchella conica CCBAS932]|uniref:Uncharacterized protein n=1 Tax=Morchella conica CCBAS932 TaxID=1392247 RepID=A0A3N4KDP2_9PEZI|nr:hypothetical protein P167DRAFT_580415 [Morchella conica CCBAS932]
MGVQPPHQHRRRSLTARIPYALPEAGASAGGRAGELGLQLGWRAAGGGDVAGGENGELRVVMVVMMCMKVETLLVRNVIAAGAWYAALTKRVKLLGYLSRDGDDTGDGGGEFYLYLSKVEAYGWLLFPSVQDISSDAKLSETDVCPSPTPLKYHILKPQNLDWKQPTILRLPTVVILQMPGRI